MLPAMTIFLLAAITWLLARDSAGCVTDGPEMQK